MRKEENQNSPLPDPPPAHQPAGRIDLAALADRRRLRRPMSKARLRQLRKSQRRLTRWHARDRKRRAREATDRRLRERVEEYKIRQVLGTPRFGDPPGWDQPVWQNWPRSPGRWLPRFLPTGRNAMVLRAMEPGEWLSRADIEARTGLPRAEVGAVLYQRFSRHWGGGPLVERARNEAWIPRLRPGPLAPENPRILWRLTRRGEWWRQAIEVFA